MGTCSSAQTFKAKLKRQKKTSNFEVGALRREPSRIMSQETVLSDYEGKYQDKFLASTEFGKEASGTIGDYLTGTITLVLGIFFLFLLLSLLTIILTTYARYKGRKENPSSFANPPPRAYRPQLQEPLSNAPPATSGQSTLL